jgi:sterol desaturase/sphingolipid hydroxylase (fatty acid hydroxylase superfamily)
MVIYVFVFDFFEYWRHRFQHRLTWWWSLHALHHSQTQMTLWTDTRNHLLDDVIRHVWLVTVALLVGAPPASYLLVVVLIMAVESLSHANVRLSFGSIGDRLVVSPLFHRVHHAVEQSGARWGCNFAVLFPMWDILFRTARYDRGYLPTGIMPDGEPDYGDGFWRQQVVGVVRLAKALVGRAPPSPTADAVRDAR